MDTHQKDKYKTTIVFISRSLSIVDALKFKLSKHKEYKFKYSTDSIEGINELQYDVCVSPSNSYGELQGGVDMQYYKALGRDTLQNYVYNIIMRDYNGEILVGESCLVNLDNIRKLEQIKNTSMDMDINTTTNATNNTNKDKLPKYLLLCPTMTIPLNVNETRNAYYFTRAMIRGLNNMKRLGLECKTVLCPIPCTAVGQMQPEIAAKQISMAFDAFDKKGLIYAIYGYGDGYKEGQPGTNNAYPEYANSVLQNAKMAYMYSMKK